MHLGVDAGRGKVAWNRKVIMKGLILAAGLGTRLRPLTSLRPKPSIGVANRPLIHYAVDDLLDVDVHEIGIVVSPETRDAIEATLAPYEGRAEFTYVVQDPPEGLAHAVAAAHAFLRDDPFVMYLSDNLFERGIRPFVDAFRPDEGVNAVLALVRVADPRAFGVAEVTDGRVTDLVEKPEHPPSDLAIAGVYVFDASIHDAIEGLEPGAKDEYQITDAVQRLIDRGSHVAYGEVDGWWKDTGKAADILDANRLELARLGRHVEGTVEDTELVGDVVVEEGATVRRSTVVGPCSIAAGAVVEDAYVGPYSSIGRDVRLADAEVDDVVIGARTVIDGVASRIHGSLVGEDVRIEGAGARPRGHRLTIGDKSVLTLGDG